MSLDQPTGFVKRQTATEDAFLGGRLTIGQPKAGFRAGLESVLLGAAVTGSSRHILDLGAGVGTAALVALAHVDARRALLVDIDRDALSLASANIERNRFAGRAETLVLDAASGGKPHGTFDAVIANPPFFTEGRGTPASTRGAVARHMPEADLEGWLRTAAASTVAGGEAIFIMPAVGLEVLLRAMSPRFGALTILPLSPRPGAPANRILVRGLKGSRAPLSLLHSRSLHEREGQAFVPEFEAILRGEATLRW